MDLSTSIGSIKLKKPLMPAAGPLVGSYEKMMALLNMGVGCMVTKTISRMGAQVPRPCIYGEKGTIMNAELWSEYPLEYWLDEILPPLKRDLTVPLIISTGYTKEDMESIIPPLDEFADAFEVSTHYVGKDLRTIEETVKTIKNLTNKPVFMKLSPHIPDWVEFARVSKSSGASGVVAINSLGPVIKIDPAGRRVIMGNGSGELWMSGPVIKPLALAAVHRIKTSLPDFTVIGTGGVESADDVIEFLLSGADAVQMLSGAMIKGKKLYEKIVDDLPEALKKYNFSSVQDVRNTKLQLGSLRFEPEYPVIDSAKCKLCGLCEKICPYFALHMDKSISVDTDKCFGCGLCQFMCPSKAISNVL